MNRLRWPSGCANNAMPTSSPRRSKMHWAWIGGCDAKPAPRTRRRRSPRLRRPVPPSVAGVPAGSRVHPLRRRLPPRRIPLSGPRRRACWPRPARTTRRHRAATPKRPLWSCCKTNWARAASITASRAIKPDPERFDPDRFAPGQAKNRAHAYKPFGTGGQRACIGRQFALHEAVLTLGLILHRYDLTPEHGYRLRIAETITLKPRGFRLALGKRHASSRLLAADT